jgi:hypothetical protein
VAKKTKAKAEVKQLDLAFRAIQSDYRGWSTLPNGPADVGSIVIGFLRGGNSRGAIYMEFDASATNGAGFADPWYNVSTAPNNIYKYVLALPGVGSIAPYGGGSTVYREIGAWSKGKDGLDGTAAQQKDDVTSWMQ